MNKIKGVWADIRGIIEISQYLDVDSHWPDLLIIRRCKKEIKQCDTIRDIQYFITDLVRDCDGLSIKSYLLLLDLAKDRKESILKESGFVG